MGKIKKGIPVFILLLVFGASSCSIEKRLYTRGFHVEFHKREKTSKSEVYVQDLEKQACTTGVQTEKKEDNLLNQVYSAPSDLRIQNPEFLTEAVPENAPINDNTFQHQKAGNAYRTMPVKVSELMKHQTIRTSQKSLKNINSKKQKDPEE